MMTDPLADMFTRLRNANTIGRKQVPMPASRIKVGVAEVLKNEGFIASYEVVAGQPASTLQVQLKYGPDGEKVIRSIDRVSKPGQRVYSGAQELKPVLRGQVVEFAAAFWKMFSEGTEPVDISTGRQVYV